MDGHGEGRGRRNVLDTGVVTVISDDPNNDVATPLTETLRAIEFKEVALEAWLGALTKINVRAGVQFSNDPVAFTNAVTKELTIYLSTAGWTFSTQTYDLWSLAGLADADYGMYLRFVGPGKTTQSSTLAESLLLRLLVHSEPVVARSALTPWFRANSKGSTTLATFIPARARSSRRTWRCTGSRSSGPRTPAAPSSLDGAMGDGSTTKEREDIQTHNGGWGPVIPAGHSTWNSARSAYVRVRDAGSGTVHPDVRARAMCGLIALGGTILHEIVHLCAPWKHQCDPNTGLPYNYLYVGPALEVPSPGFPIVQPVPDACCNDIARMTHSIFMWAMTQRYSCLRKPTPLPVAGYWSTCCPAADGANFANSGLLSDDDVGFLWNRSC